MLQPRIDFRKGTLGFLIVYAGCLLLTLPHLSLWLDEIIQLLGTRDLSFTNLMSYVARDTGQVPLGYVAQFAIIRVAGYSIYSARILSVVSSLFACLGMMKLCGRRRSQETLASVALLAIFPLQFRYALEARPYELALCISIWGSVVFLKLAEKVSLRYAGLYAGLLILGIYTQPFTIFVGVAHLVWASLVRGVRTRVTLVILFVLVVSAAAYMPWFIHQRSASGPSILALHLGPTVTAKTPLLIIRELIGAGYPGSVLVIAGVAIALSSSRVKRDEKFLGGLLTLLPLIGPLIIDWRFNYFVASRQWLFAIPGLAYLAGFAVSSGKTVRWIYGLVTAATLIYFDIHWINKPRENWAAATTLLSKISAHSNACTIFVPPNSLRYYSFFDPSLPNTRCQADKLHTAKQVLVALSPYGPGNPAHVQKRLSKNGYVVRLKLNRDEPKIELYRRDY